MAWIDLDENWVLVKGPSIEVGESGFRMKHYCVHVTAFRSKEKNRSPRETERVYTVCRISIPIPSINRFLYLPEVETAHKELWEVPLLREKIISAMLLYRVRPEEAFVERALSDLADKIRGGDKFLKLQDDAALEGNLWHEKLTHQVSSTHFFRHFVCD